MQRRLTHTQHVKPTRKMALSTPRFSEAFDQTPWKARSEPSWALAGLVLPLRLWFPFESIPNQKRYRASKTTHSHHLLKFSDWTPQTGKMATCSFAFPPPTKKRARTGGHSSGGCGPGRRTPASTLLGCDASGVESSN